ncbi:hypothetical protein NA63_0241 [Flavobacteriaceae bacterium MAR_2010_105]|nr:hypothetical protein NA63_0241 [Flavobacteriaceae bacterium MAR_2010_105]
METTKRLDNALRKLYKAFHDGSLHPECCKQCAVGNILDNTDAWKHLSDSHGSVILNYVGLVNQNFGRRFNGYTPLELLKIEAEFLKGCGYTLPLNQNGKNPQTPTAKETLFYGLCKTVEFLCKLDGIDNVMEYSKLLDLKKPKIEFNLTKEFL